MKAHQSNIWHADRYNPVDHPIGLIKVSEAVDIPLEQGPRVADCHSHLIVPACSACMPNAG